MFMRKTKSETRDPKHAGRRRGGLLFDVSLGLIVLLGVFGFITNYTIQMKQKQEEALIAAETKSILDGARAYVKQDYNQIALDLYAKASAGSPAIEQLSMSDLQSAGFLPANFTGSGFLKAKYGQDFALMLRAVNRSDTNTPQATMTLADLDPTSSGHIDPTLMDRDGSNGEMDIEAILVSHGGTPIKAAEGGRILALIQNSYVGYIRDANVASGPFGSFSFNISGFNSLSDYPGTGHLTALVALSNFGVLGVDDGADSALLDPFHRCEGMNTHSAAYSQCLQNNDVYTDIILHPYDSNGDGSVDTYPALRGLTAVSCANSGAPGTANTFTIDCSQTDVTGNMSVAGNVNVSGTDNTLGNLATSATGLDFKGSNYLENKSINGSDKNVVQPDRLVYGDLNGGQDMSEAILDSRIVRAQGVVDKPVCPATTIDGTPMLPRIYVTPAAYSDAAGRPVVGVRAYAEDLGTQWKVHLLSFVGRDYCTNDVTTPLPDDPNTNTWKNNAPEYVPNTNQCSNFNPSGNVTADRSDGKADVYEISSNYGAVLVQTRCY